jgi:hypothetical protein
MTIAAVLDRFVKACRQQKEKMEFLFFNIKNTENGGGQNFRVCFNSARFYVQYSLTLQCIV